MYYTQEQIDRANQADLVLFLQSQGEPLERAGQEYRWKRHDSLTVRGNKWYRHSQSKGGGPIDFVMEFFGKSFTEAVELLTGEKGAAPPPDRPSSAPLSDFRLPPRSPDNRTARNYLTAARRIDEDVTGFFFASGDIYEDAAHHNAVFVGRDEDGIPRYAHSKGTAGNFRLDVKGSDKAFNFCYRGEGERVFVFEAPVDLLSFLCLFKKDWQKQSYLSLGGVGEKALLRFLSDRPNIKTVYLCLDSDEAGNDACSRLVKLMPEGYTVHRLIPLFKDWNEVLQHRAEITDGKYLREAVYGLKGPPQEETVEIIRMSEVDTQTVEWLWEPYIPFGKVTIVQGNPGEGKTTFALRLAAACTNRKPFPHMAVHEPFNVIYQTAEDGLGDTIKPRLMEAEADLDRILVIDESKQGLSLSDERIERAIRQTGARLIILDPIQAYVGEKTDMNKANEIRPMFRRLAEIAERTGCAVILIGHLNKAAGGQSAYRGLGSIDFRAAARSVLLIGRVKRDRKTALFLIMSDTDSTFNFVIAMLQSQLFNLLCDKADDEYGGKLPVHVRCLLDEFANIGQIPQFEKLIATIRSREISASIILQSQSQLKAIYKDAAEIILDNADSTLFLGGRGKNAKDISENLGRETIDSFNTSENRGTQVSHGLNYQKLGKELMTQDEIAVMDGGKCILQLRGVRPFFSDKYDITQHPNYKYLSDFDKKNAFDVERYMSTRPAIVKPDEPFDIYEIDLSDEDAAAE
ncbi:TraM recognition domain-containing protein [Enterocloster clostridioformis]|nr:AAA family ATPase [Enterocloster clostridioformis]NSJ56783.1 TraM recognition domain-containing protein [Enterocloster clostridioformis]